MNAILCFVIICILAFYLSDWLSVGKSFAQGKMDDMFTVKHNFTDSSASTMQVYRHQHDKHGSIRKKRCKRQNRPSDDSTTVSSHGSYLLAKHKKKRKDKKRDRSRYQMNSSDDGKLGHCSSVLSARSSYLVQSRFDHHIDEERTERKPVKDNISCIEKADCSVATIFEFDRIGDRDNQFFGSSYLYDQPLYVLASRRNSCNGVWISQAQLSYGRSDTTVKEKRVNDLIRYFSPEAQKLEINSQQKRLHLAYSDQRMSNKSAESKMQRSTHNYTEVAYIPLDPSLDTVNDAILDDDADRILLTDIQSMEQHLVKRNKMLNLAVMANPHNIQNWLDLIAFQDDTLRLHIKTKRINSVMKASVMEKQVAIVARALAKNPGSRVLHRIKLNMALQSQTCNRVAGVESILLQKIEHFLDKDPTNCELWLKLLQYRLQQFGSFSMQSVRDLYARIFTVLRKECEANATVKISEQTMPDLDKCEKMKTSQHLDKTLAFLLEFHFLMCRFEKKAGFIERSLSHAQALIDFSFDDCRIIASSSSKDTHLSRLQQFAKRWNDKDVPRIGEIRRGMTFQSNSLPKDSSNQALVQFQNYIFKIGSVNIDHVNPPEVVRTDKHQESLLTESAAYKRQTYSSGKKAFDVIGTEQGKLSRLCDESEMEFSKLVYSNLHGYRIKVDNANDSKEYERILDELRRTSKNGQARQIRLQDKGKKKGAVLAATISQLEDQRANYDSVDEDDRFLSWLHDEEVQKHLQWIPLRSDNPQNQNLIVQQPDRVTLTEEIQPFLFYVPKVHRWRLIAEILEIFGVEWCGEFSWKTDFPECASMCADSPTDYELLVSPILSVLSMEQGTSKHNLLFLDPNDRKTLLENTLLKDVVVKQDVLSDPSKVAFVRRIFEQGLELCQKLNEVIQSTLKCLWIGFEAEVIRMTGASSDSVANARLLSQRLAKNSTDNHPDLRVLFAYAKLELNVGNERQGYRVCEKALKSLKERNLVGDSNFHRFTFLQARLELWSPFKSRDQKQLRLLRCLYTLWRAQQPNRVNGKEIEALDTIGKLSKKQFRARLQEQLMSDPSTRSDLIAKYRADLGSAAQHCALITSRSPEDSTANYIDSNPFGCYVGYCLHNLALIVYAYDGFDAACRVYRQFLTNSEHQDCKQEVWAWTCFLEFMQQHQLLGLSPRLAPRLWRLTISEAVEYHPYNEVFLRLFADSDKGNTISQVHRKYSIWVEKRWRRYYDSPDVIEWLFMLLCEIYRVERAATILELSRNVDPCIDEHSHPMCCVFHRWGRNTTGITRIRQLFENIVTQFRTKGSALCWELYLRFEVALGKIDAATKVLYRGIASCPWSKSLYMNGLRILRAYLSEEECHELLEFMESKELSVRADLK